MAAEAVQGATSSGGGADPITAIANAAGDLFNMVGTIFKGSSDKKLAYQQWLTSTFPEFKYFFNNEKRKDNTWILLLIMGVVAIIVIVAVVVKQNKE